MTKDKNGLVIKEFDVLKVFHFTGARRKKHYVYKSVRKSPKTGELMIVHLTSDESWVPMKACCSDEVWEDAEIVERVYVNE